MPDDRAVAGNTGSTAPGEPQARRTEARDVIGLFATRMVLVPASLVVGILVTRALGPENRGVFAFVSLVIGFLGPVLQAGFGNGVRYFVTAGEISPARAAYSAAGISLVLGVMGALLLGVLWRLGLLGESSQLLSIGQMGSVLFLLPFVFCGTVLNWMLLGDSQFGATNLLELARNVVLILLLVVLVLFAGLGIDGAIWALLASHLAFSLAVSWVVVRKYHPQAALDVPFVKRSFAYGSRVWIGSMAVRSNDRLDQMFLALFGSPAQLGFYSVAVRVAELPLMAGTFVGPVLFNRLAGSTDQADRAALTSRVHRLQVGLMTLLVASLAGVGWFAIPLVYGEAFRPAVLPLLLYLPGVIANASQQELSRYFSATGQPLTSSAIQVGALAVGLVAFPLLIAAAESAGAAIASTIVYAVAALLGMTVFLRSTGSRAMRLVAVTRDDLRWCRHQVSAGVQAFRASLRRRLMGFNNDTRPER